MSENAEKQQLSKNEFVSLVRTALRGGGIEFTEEQMVGVSNAVASAIDEKPSYGAWSSIRKGMNAAEKSYLGKYFVNHDFLVPVESNDDVRMRVASILVNQGTTPNAVVNQALDWLSNNWDKHGPFDLTWFSPGGLVPAR